MSSARNFSTFLSLVGSRLSPGSLLALLLPLLLLVSATPTDARPICAPVLTMPFDHWIELGDTPSEDVYEVEAPAAGTLFFAWREAETPARALAPLVVEDPCDPVHEASASARNAVFLPHAGSFLVRLANASANAWRGSPTEILAHFRPARVPIIGSIEEATRAGRPPTDAASALTCLARLQQLDEPSGFDPSHLIDPTTGSASAPNSIDEWEIDILSLGEDPEEGDPWVDPAEPPPSDLEEWEIDIRTVGSESTDPESLWPAWEPAVRRQTGTEDPDLPQDLRETLEQMLAASPEAHLEIHRLLVARPGMLEIARDTGEVIGILRTTPGASPRWVERAAAGSASTVRGPVVPGLYTLVEVVAAGSQGIDGTRVRVYEICP